jgi:hypothetical protein
MYFKFRTGKSMQDNRIAIVPNAQTAQSVTTRLLQNLNLDQKYKFAKYAFNEGTT